MTFDSDSSPLCVNIILLYLYADLDCAALCEDEGQVHLYVYHAYRYMCKQ